MLREDGRPPSHVSTGCRKYPGLCRRNRGVTPAADYWTPDLSTSFRPTGTNGEGPLPCAHLSTPGLPHCATCHRLYLGSYRGDGTGQGPRTEGLLLAHFQSFYGRPYRCSWTPPVLTARRVLFLPRISRKKETTHHRILVKVSRTPQSQFTQLDRSTSCNRRLRTVPGPTHRTTPLYRPLVPDAPSPPAPPERIRDETLCKSLLLGRDWICVTDFP